MRANVITKILRVPKKIWLILIVVLFASGFFYFRNNKSEPLKYEQAGKGVIRSTVSATGNLTGKDKVSVRFLSGGKLSFLGFKVGDKVKKGATLASLDTKDLSLAVQQAEADLRGKQASAEKILDDVKDHSADETFAQKELRTAAEVARDKAVSALDRARESLRSSSLSAPISGVITDSNYYTGQFVTSADSIYKIVDWSSIYFDAEIDESDTSKVFVGQKAIVSLNSYEDITFDGLVEQIYPQTISTSSGATVVKVRINLGNPQITFLDGLGGDVSIVIAQHDQALLINRDALSDDNKVLVSVNGKIEERVVNVGIDGDSQVEIMDGINEGETIVINPSAYKKPRQFPFFTSK